MEIGRVHSLVQDADDSNLVFLLPVDDNVDADREGPVWLIQVVAQRTEVRIPGDSVNCGVYFVSVCLKLGLPPLLGGVSKDVDEILSSFLRKNDG